MPDIPFGELATELCHHAHAERLRLDRWKARGTAIDFTALRHRVDRLETAAAILMSLALDEAEVRAIALRRLTTERPAAR